MGLFWPERAGSARAGKSRLFVPRKTPEKPAFAGSPVSVGRHRSVFRVSARARQKRPKHNTVQEPSRALVARGGDVLAKRSRLASVAPNGNGKPAEAGVSRLFSGQKEAGFCRCKPALLSGQKKPAFAGFRRLPSVAPNGKGAGFFGQKPAPFWPKAGFFGRRRSRLWPA